MFDGSSCDNFSLLSQIIKLSTRRYLEGFSTWEKPGPFQLKFMEIQSWL
jgi:hypothetical protein